MLDNILSFLICIADSYMLYRFCKPMFRMKYHGKWFAMWFMGHTILTYCVNSVGLIWVNIVFISILNICAAKIEFHISWKNAIVYGLIYYVMAAGAEGVMETLYCVLEVRWFSDPALYSIENSFPIEWITVGLLFCVYLLRFGTILLIGRYTRKLDVERSQEFAWYLLIIPLSSLFIFISHLYVSMEENPATQLFICICTVFLYFSNVVMFIIMDKYGTVLNRIKEEELVEVKRQLEDERMKELEIWNEKYRCYMHDVHAILRNVRTLASKGENASIIHVIDEVEGEQQLEADSGLKLPFYSGGNVLSAILLDKQEKAKRNGIKLDIFVEQFLKMDFIRECDLISMFGNLMDNAMEAAGQCEAGERNVSVKLFMGNPYMLVLYIENSYRVPFQYSGERILSTKQGNGHGLGIGIVSKLAERYGGTLSLEMKEDIVVTTLCISSNNQAIDKKVNF